MNVAALLDELRSIAQLGLNYAQDPYDRERYERLMQLAVTEYSSVTGLAEGEISERFRQELGYVTPKVGCAAGIFNEQGQVLLVKRSDNGRWGLPAGFCEVNQTPRENIKREVREETGLEVEVGALIDVFSVLPGEYGQPNTLYALVFMCKVIGGTLTASHETPVVGYYDHKLITEWHFDHGHRVERAYQYWLEQSE
ncbi:MAG: NUDIX domain-containing protein [Anaerolineaceae bacterium]|nr:NUDIX domain-containing protein [Anaerolineaceae bacterium]